MSATRPLIADVHFVEDERLAGLVGRGDGLHRQHDPGEFSARGDPGKGTQALPGVRREQQLSGVEASPAPSGGLVPERGQLELTARAFQREPKEFRADAFGKRPRGGVPLR